LKSYLPLFINMDGKKVIIIGGGTVAERKVKLLANYRCEITIISPSITDRLADLVKKGKIVWKKKEFQKTDLSKPVCLVIAATNNKELNDNIVNLCENENILVNSVTDKKTVIFPAVAEKGDITLAVSTGGSFPYFSKILKRELEKFISPYSKLLKIIKPFRFTLLTESGDSLYNKKIIKKFFSLPLLKWITEGKIALIKKEIKNILNI